MKSIAALFSSNTQNHCFCSDHDFLYTNEKTDNLEKLKDVSRITQPQSDEVCVGTRGTYLLIADQEYGEGFGAWEIQFPFPLACHRAG